MFRPSKHGTTAGREILAGVTTSAAMAYILVVNPDMLSLTGLRSSIPITSTALTDAAAQRPFCGQVFGELPLKGPTLQRKVSGNLPTPVQGRYPIR